MMNPTHDGITWHTLPHALKWAQARQTTLGKPQHVFKLSGAYVAATEPPRQTDDGHVIVIDGRLTEQEICALTDMFTRVPIAAIGRC